MVSCVSFLFRDETSACRGNKMVATYFSDAGISHKNPQKILWEKFGGTGKSSTFAVLSGGSGAGREGAGAAGRKNFSKNFSRKVWRFGKKVYFCTPERKRGETGAAGGPGAGARRKPGAGARGGRGTESSLTDCDRSNSKKRASKPGRPGGRCRANEREGIPETDRRKIIRNNYHEEFDPGSG